jgi:hypothetical protein
VLTRATVDQAMSSWTRGFVRDGEVYAYVGEDFRPVPRGALESLIPAIASLASLPDHARVYSGMAPGRPGEDWPPAEAAGTVGSLRPR